MTHPNFTPYTLTPNSTRLSSIGDIRWGKGEKTEPVKLNAADVSRRGRQFVRIVGDELVFENEPSRFELEPINSSIRGAIPSYPDWQIARPLPIEISFDGDGTVIASDMVFHRYGTGESIDEATNDLMDNLFVYYDIVGEYTNEKRPANQALLAHLKTYLSSVSE